MRMDEIGIEIKFGIDDEYQGTVYVLSLALIANNGRFQGQLQWYCTPQELKGIGEGLSRFPQKVPDEYLYEVGSLKPEDRYWYYFSIRAFTYDMSGRCLLQIAIKKNNDYEPDKEECRFSIEAEAWAIHRLGELIKNFSTLKYSYLKWSLNPDNDLLVDRIEKD